MCASDGIDPKVVGRFRGLLVSFGSSFTTVRISGGVSRPEVEDDGVTVKTNNN